MLTTLYDDGTARHDIIDVEMDEKRKRDDRIGQQGRRIHFRNDETPIPVVSLRYHTYTRGFAATSFPAEFRAIGQNNGRKPARLEQNRKQM